MAINIRQCISCGKFFELSKKNNTNYCSKECQDIYHKCIICGDYYLLEDFLDKDNLICSVECSKRYRFSPKKDNKSSNLKNL
ncbi:MAG: hypothetical protein JXB50_03365, partial [Spirochaetes bacterium]|nr:hypothetical protein [Spirochaetota bacterium]